MFKSCPSGFLIFSSEIFAGSESGTGGTSSCICWDSLSV